MNDRYKYQDPIFKDSTKYDFLKIGNSNSSLLNVFRLISGTINCKDDYQNENYKFRNNYTEFPYEINTSIKQSIVKECFPEEVKLKDLNHYFKVSRSNQKFYSSIEVELLKCLIAESNGNHLEAFFYLYRVIEGISYSLPLIYVSKSKSYNKSFKQLQSYFKQESDGELAFFKKFICEIFKEEDFFKSTIDIDLTTISVEDLRESYFKIYVEKINNSALIDSTEFEEIKVSFIGFYELIIEIRNRFFHFKQGAWQENLSSTDIMYPDFFFKPLIGHGLNWVSIILFEIIKNDFVKEKEL